MNSLEGSKRPDMLLISTLRNTDINHEDIQSIYNMPVVSLQNEASMKLPLNSFTIAAAALLTFWSPWLHAVAQQGASQTAIIDLASWKHCSAER